MAGLLTTRVECPSGPHTIVFHFGESLQPDGTVLNQYGDIMNAQYTCRGTGAEETYTTLFSQYGFRYVQVPLCSCGRVSSVDLPSVHLGSRD